MTSPVSTGSTTPETFFKTGKVGDWIRLGSDPEPWEVLEIARGSHARIAKAADKATTFAYLRGTLLQLENLKGPSHNCIEFVS